MPDVLPNVEGDVGFEEATAVILVDQAGTPYTASSKGKVAYVGVALTMDTAAYAQNEVLADTQVISNAFRANDLGGEIETITVIDKDDLATVANDAIDLIFLSDNVSIGAENSAPNISDANAEHILCKISIAGTDFIDMGGCKVATVGNLRRAVVPKAGTRDLYMAAMTATGAAPTHTAAGVYVRLGIIQD